MNDKNRPQYQDDMSDAARSISEPFDAANRRAYFERTDRFNAFQDGLDSPEIQAAIVRARDKAIAKIKARKANE